MIPYGKQSISKEDIDAVSAVLKGDWLTTGPAVVAFEAELSRLANAAAVAVSSGTAALHTAYAASGVGVGSEIVTTPLTFVATASTAMSLGASVKFADVCEDTGNLDPAAVAAVISEQTAVVAAVDYGGHPADIDGLRDVISNCGALLLEDAAHSIGGHLGDRPIGSLADVTTFSFFPTKNLTTAEGGAVVSPDADLIERARRFRTIGLVRDPESLRYPDEGPWHQEVHALGLNYRLNDLQSALGLSQLKRLREFVARRALIHTRYSEAFRDVSDIKVPVCRDGVRPAWHLYSLRVLDGRRRSLYNYLHEQGIGVQVNYVPVYWHPLFEDLGYRRGLCPVAEEYYSQELSLPLFPALEDAEVDRTIDLILEFFGN